MLKICYTLLFLPVFAGLTHSEKFVITGKLGNWNAPAKVYLKYTGADGMTTDSSLLKDGRFQITGNGRLRTPASLFLSTDGHGIRWPYDELQFYIDHEVRIYSRDSAKNAMAGGSVINEDFNRLNTALKPVYKRVSAIEDMLGTVDPEVKRSVDFQKKTDSLRAGIQADEDAVYRRFASGNLSSFISLNALYELTKTAVSSKAFSDIQQMFDQLTPELKRSREGVRFAEQLKRRRNLSIGCPAPDFSQPDSNGLSVSLSSFQGKYVLVDFWASWCKPCRKENKHLVMAYQRFRDKQFTIVGVSIDQQRDKWLNAVYEDQLPWVQLSDLKRINEAADLYDIRSYPSNYLLDPDGKIIAKNIHGQELINKLEELLDESD